MAVGRKSKSSASRGGAPSNEELLSFRATLANLLVEFDRMFLATSAPAPTPAAVGGARPKGAAHPKGVARPKKKQAGGNPTDPAMNAGLMNMGPGFPYPADVTSSPMFAGFKAVPQPFSANVSHGASTAAMVASVSPKQGMLSP